jgi:hypothetical protein
MHANGFQNLNIWDHLKDQSVDEGITLIPVFMTGSEIVDCVRPSITVFRAAPSVSVLRQKSPIRITFIYLQEISWCLQVQVQKDSQVTMQDLRF